jgi:Tol biopolymer transport system component
MPLIALVVVESSCGGGTEPSPLPPPGDSPVLVFTSERDGDPEIYVVDAAGARRLTNRSGTDDNPAWSPDGARIVFEKDGALWSMRADGSDVLRLTTPPTGALDVRQNGIPLPSSDGRVLYSRYASPGPTTLRIVNVNGSNDHELTVGSVPTWSANGSQVAFNVISGGTSDVYLISADGSQRRNLTNTPADHEDWPVLSPDGQQVAFISSNDGITIMKTDGTGRTPLVRAGNVYQWSPDGSKIAYRSPRAGTNFLDVWVVNADGSGKRQLTDENFSVNAIRWSPDGSRIAIDNGRPPNTHIYVMNADGSDLRRLTPATSSDYQPEWRP